MYYVVGDSKRRISLARTTFGKLNHCLRLMPNSLKSQCVTDSDIEKGTVRSKKTKMVHETIILGMTASRLRELGSSRN